MDTVALQKESLDICNMICAVCDKHQIRYYLAAGTLLGAIRHKGFIPWDDDMGDATAQKIYLQKLKQEWLPQMGFETHSATYYDSRFSYAKFLLVKYAPYPVFFIVLTGYQRWKRGRNR